MAPFRNLLMRVPAKRLLGQSFFYLMVNVLVAFGPLLLIPFLTRVLTPESYGIYGNFLAALGVLGVMLGLNTDVMVRRHGHDSLAHLKHWVTASLSVLALMTALMAGAILVVQSFAPAWLEAVGVPRNYLLLLVLGGALLVVSNLVGFIATMRERLMVFGILRLGTMVLFVAMAFGFYLGLRGVVGDVLLARVASLMCAGAFGILWLWRLGVLAKLNELAEGWKRVPAALKYGVPLLPSIFYDPLMTLINRMALTHHQTLADAGQYTLAYQLAQPLQLLSGSVGLALFPHMVRWFDENTPDTRKKFVVTGFVTAGVLLAVWFGYAVVTLPWLLPWIGGAEYMSAAPLVAPLALAFVAGGLSVVLANRYFHNGQTWWISFCCLFGLSINVVLCQMTPTLNGVAWAMVAGYLGSCIWLGLGLVGEDRVKVKKA